MTDSFEAMKKNRNPSELAEKLNKISGGAKAGNSYADERVWKPTPDAVGNYSGIIRFLPPPKGEADPFVKVYNHGFQKNGKWFIENCPTTLGNDCPVCESNSELWGSGLESDKKTASQRKRKISYYANIVVVNDPSNPQNNGKHFLYRFGVKIMEKIEAAVEGDTAVGQEGIDVVNFWEGANLVLKMRKGEGNFTTYQDSQFQPPSPLFDGNDEQLCALWESLYSLRDYHDPSKFMTYDELSAKYNKFLHGRSSKAQVDSESPQEESPKNPAPRDFNPHQEQGTTESPPFDTNTPVNPAPTGEKKSPLEVFQQMKNG